MFALVALCFQLFIRATGVPPKSRVSGLRAARSAEKKALIELAVDNFFMDFFFNDFNAEPGEPLN